MAAATMLMYEYESDLRNNEHYLGSSENKDRNLNSCIFISFSAVHINDFHIFILHGFI